MKKELLTKEKIRADLLVTEKTRFWRRAQGIVDGAILVLLLSILLCVIVQTLWIAVPFACALVVLAVLFLRELNVWRARCKRVEAGDFTVGRGNYTHEDKEEVYEPHLGHKRFSLHRTVKFWYFSNGKWRVRYDTKHYAWSDLYAMSQQGLENVTLVGDEFYTVALLGDSDFGYVYPAKLFDYRE